MDAQEKAAVEVRDVTAPSPKTVEGAEARDAKPAAKGDEDQIAAERGEATKKSEKSKCDKKHGKSKKSKKHKKGSAPEGDSDESDSDAESQDTSSSDSDSSDSDSSDSDSDSEDAKKKRVTKKRHDLHKSKKKVKSSKKTKKPGKPKAAPLPSDTDSDSSSSDTEDDDESDRGGSQQRKQQQQQQQHQQQELARLMQLQQLQLQQDNSFQYPRATQLDPLRVQINDRGRSRRAGHPPSNRDLMNFLDNRPPPPAKLKQKRHKSPRMDYKRVDQIWDTSIHNYKLQDTAEGAADAQYDEYLFHVRRTFDWEGKYKQTVVDIKSKLLRECLQDVMGNIKGVSLVEDKPKLDPNMLFL